ncbi:hypothetical protein GCM10011316_01360 [Roseibium aquae]|uniref:Uncharacterized protein n=1 Tax=Roseibium aquae TaxID=1323746 RepID=A0A916T7C2_9HYPH|nr:hypothetical protein GCM10011316_01360 [Roseibium aquae]
MSVFEDNRNGDGFRFRIRINRLRQSDRDLPPFIDPVFGLHYLPAVNGDFTAFDQRLDAIAAERWDMGGQHGIKTLSVVVCGNPQIVLQIRICRILLTGV